MICNFKYIFLFSEIQKEFKDVTQNLLENIAKVAQDVANLNKQKQ